MMRYALARADKELFAVYHTIYSNADIEMWYDWDKRLDDTRWTDDCFFVACEGRKIGGLIVTEGGIRNPFLIPPFSDRLEFWRFVLEETRYPKITGALDADARILSMFGYRIDRIGQVMTRPTDVLPSVLPEGFFCRPLELSADAEEVASVLVRGYEGGICNAVNGVATREEVVDDLHKVLGIYAPKNWSRLIVEKDSGKIVAVCLAGRSEHYVHGCGEIADLCVLPAYRNRGLARYLLARAVSEAHESAPFVKLFVYVGNSAEYLYAQMGFMAGPRFTNMSRGYA